MFKTYTLTEHAQQAIAHARGTARKQCVSGGSACVSCQVFRPGCRGGAPFLTNLGALDS